MKDRIQDLRTHQAVVEPLIVFADAHADVLYVKFLLVDANVAVFAVRALLVHDHATNIAILSRFLLH